MPAGTKDANIRVRQKGAKATDSSLKKVDNRLTSMGRSALTASAGFLGAAGLIVGFKKAVAAAGEQEQAEKRLEVALGGVNQSLLDQASALQQQTVFGDESIIGVQASVAAFTKNEDAIKQVTAATLDMTAATGMDLKAAGDLIAKTFGSSTNALARYGVVVEGAAGSTERLESLTEGIAKLWGGQATAQAETMTGRIDQMKNALGDTAEIVGGAASPAIVAMSEIVRDSAQAWNDWFNIFDGVRTDLVGGSDEIQSLAEEGVKLNEMVQGLKSGTVDYNDAAVELNMNWLLGINNANILAEAERLLLENQEALTESLREYNIEQENLARTTAEATLNLNLESDSLGGLEMAGDAATQTYKELAASIFKVGDAEKETGRLRETAVSAAISGISSLASINKNASHANALFAKRAAQLEAAVNTAAAVTLALKSAPPPFNFILAASTGAAGLAQIAAIEAAQFAGGGIVGGSGNRDTELIAATPGELILNAAQQDNVASQVSGGVVFNISGNLVASESEADRFAEIIENRSRLNLNNIQVKA